MLSSEASKPVNLQSFAGMVSKVITLDEVVDAFDDMRRGAVIRSVAKL